MNPGLLRGFPGDTKPRYIYVAEVLYDVTLGSSGAFDTNDVWPAGLPTGYDRLELHLLCRSTVAATSDSIYMFFNNDTTLANYRRQNNERTDAGAGGASLDQPFIGESSGANSTGDDFGYITVNIMNPENSKRKSASSTYFARRSATATVVGVNGLNWESTDPIRRIQLRTDNHATDLLAAGSSARLIGYRNISISELLG